MLSRSTTTKSWSEYLVKISTQKSTLGSIDFGRGNVIVVSDHALGAAAKANAIASANAAIVLTAPFPLIFPSNNAVSIARESPSARSPARRHFKMRLGPPIKGDL